MKTSNKINSIFWIYLIIALFREVVEVCFGWLVLASILSYVLLIIALIAIVFYAPKALLPVNIVLLVGIPVLFLLSVLFFPETETYVYDILPLVITGRVPALLLMLNVTDWDDFYSKMKRYSIPYFLLGVLYLGVFLLGFFDEELTNYMRMAYNVLTSVCVLGVIGLVEKKFVYNLLFWIALIAIFLSGCRGALAVGVVVYSLLLFIIRKVRYSKWIISGVLLAGILVTLNFDNLESFIISHDSESRIARKMDAGTLFESEGRVIIRTVVWSEIQARNYHPQGLCADRVISDRVLGRPSYVHNIILEFIVNYGLIIGVLLFISLLVLLIVTAKKSEMAVTIVLCFFASYSLSKLMISSSYLEELSFYIFMGALFAAHRTLRISNKKAILKK